MKEEYDFTIAQKNHYAKSLTWHLPVPTVDTRIKDTTIKGSDQYMIKSFE